MHQLILKLGDGRRPRADDMVWMVTQTVGCWQRTDVWADGSEPSPGGGRTCPWPLECEDDSVKRSLSTSGHALADLTPYPKLNCRPNCKS